MGSTSAQSNYRVTFEPVTELVIPRVVKRDIHIREAMSFDHYLGKMDNDIIDEPCSKHTFFTIDRMESIVARMLETLEYKIERLNDTTLTITFEIKTMIVEHEISDILIINCYLTERSECERLMTLETEVLALKKQIAPRGGPDSERIIALENEVAELKKQITACASLEKERISAIEIECVKFMEQIRLQFKGMTATLEELADTHDLRERVTGGLKVLREHVGSELSIARNVAIQTRIADTERIFGHIPPQWIDFARKVFAAEIDGKPIIFSNNLPVMTGYYLSLKEACHSFPPLWIPLVIAYVPIAICSHYWRYINCSRLIIYEAHGSLPAGWNPCKKCGHPKIPCRVQSITYHPRVRELIIDMSSSVVEEEQCRILTRSAEDLAKRKVRIIVHKNYTIAEKKGFIANVETVDLTNVDLNNFRVDDQLRAELDAAKKNDQINPEQC